MFYGIATGPEMKKLLASREKSVIVVGTGIVARAAFALEE